MTTTQNKEMREHIFNEMSNYFAMCGADQYGQHGVIDVYSVFKDTTDNVLEYIKQDPMFKVNTYGWRYGTYKGIGGMHDIKDEDMRKACESSWRNNENRLKNLNQW